MTLEYDDCLKRGKIKTFSRGKSLVPKELETAASDLERSKKTYKDGDYKWATIRRNKTASGSFIGRLARSKESKRGRRLLQQMVKRGVREIVEISRGVIR